MLRIPGLWGTRAAKSTTSSRVRRAASRQHLRSPLVALERLEERTLLAVRIMNDPAGMVDYVTIQAAIDAASPVAADTILVDPGTYTENVTINKNLALLSTDGRDVTTIVGTQTGSVLGTVLVTNNTTGVEIGRAGQGFTIQGIDGPSPGIESAAVYFQGSHSNARVVDNEIVANGDEALLTEFGATITGFVIDGNEFSGQAFAGANPDGLGTGDQFTQPNRPRQLVVISGGAGGGNTSNITFTNNLISGTAGGMNTSGQEQGNSLVTIDSNGATISGNTFAGTTTRSGTFSLRARGPSTTISGNMFSSVGLSPSAGHVFIQNTGQTLDQVAAANNFDKGAYVPSPTGGTFATTIQAAVNAAAPGATVNVTAGTYVEDVNVNKPLTLLGAGAATTTISGPIDGDGATVRVTANNVEVAGFTITREGNNTTDWNNPGLNSAGIAVQGQSVTGMLVHDNLITGNRTAIDVNNSSGHTIRNNVITNNRTGLFFRNQTDNLTVVENTITGNFTLGVLFLDASGGSNSPVQTAMNSTFSNNNISANWYGQIVDRQAGGSLPAPGTTNLKDFSGNWLGTTLPVITTANSAEPPYSPNVMFPDPNALIPVAFGGTATAPGGQPDVAGPASANFDITPLLGTGTDTDVETTPGRGTFGFQGSFATLQVISAGAQTGAIGRIQEGVSLATAGGTVNVLGSPGDDTFAVQAPADVTISIDGDDPTAPATPGDTLNYDAEGRTVTVTANSITSPGVQTVFFTNIETVNVQNATPTISIDDQMITEGDSGTQFLTFTVMLNVASSQSVMVNFTTQDGSATAVDLDYLPQSGTLIFLPGEVSQPITVSVRGDVKFEPNEFFSVLLSSPVGANFTGPTGDDTGIGTILNDDVQPTVSIGDTTVAEGGIATFPVTLSSLSSQAVTITYSTAGNNATQGVDYTAQTAATLVIPAGSTSGQITVSTIQDRLDEIDETFFVNLTAINATTADGQGLGSILDNDTTPVAGNDAYATNEDATLTIAAPGVLASDTDADGDPLTALLLVGPINGTLTLNPNGSFTYTPNANYNGPDSFTYRASDGVNFSTPATVTLTVVPVNDVPTAAADAYTTAEDSPLSVGDPGVLGNDSDVDGTPLTAVLVAGPTNGTLTLNGDGSFIYTPNANSSGTDSFTYRARDGALTSGVTTVTLTVTAVNDVPVAAADAYTTAEDAALTIPLPGVLANDSDADGTPLTAILVAGPTSGMLTLNPNGSFTYTPNGSFNGTDSFSYRASDGTATSNVATVTLTITAVGDSPVANADAYTTAEDTPLTVGAPGVLANDSDADGTPLTAILVAGPTNGTLILNPNGSFTYTPNTNSSGADTFTYRAGDGTTTSNVATVTITVTATNDAPSNIALIASPASIGENGTLTLGGTFADPETTDAHTVVINWGDGTVNTTINLAAGTLGFGGASHLYVDNRPGNAPYTISVTVTDSNGGGASASTAVTVTNLAPTVVIIGTPATSAEGTSINLTSTVSDPGPLDTTFTRAWNVTKDGVPFASGSSPDFGFTPDDNASYVVTLSVTDKDGGVGTATQTVIAVTNVAPTLTIGGAGTVTPGIATYTLNLASSDPGADTIARWTINWGDGSIETFAGNPTTVTHVYGRCASYTVSATATDEDGTFAAGNTVAVSAQFATANECFLAGVYVDVLRRPIDGVGLPIWSDQLNRGVSREQVALSIEQSLEGRTQQVQDYYQRFLNRAADAFGLNVFVGGLINGTMRAEDVITTILGSAEYFTLAGGTNDAFLAKVYLDVLGRPIEGAGLTGWTDELNRGVGRNQVALMILQSLEGRRSTVNGFYRRFLGRTAEPFGLDIFTEELRVGVTQEQVIAMIVGSPEYFQRNT